MATGEAAVAPVHRRRFATRSHPERQTRGTKHDHDPVASRAGESLAPASSTNRSGKACVVEAVGYLRRSTHQGLIVARMTH
jgi:hypothetical protein